MAKRCDLTGIGAQSGNNVSHSQRKSRRRFEPNLNKVTLKSDLLKQEFKLKIAASTLRSIDHNGGLDGFLLTAKAASLTELGKKLRIKIKKSLPEETIKKLRENKKTTGKTSARKELLKRKTAAEKKETKTTKNKKDESKTEAA